MTAAAISPATRGPGLATKWNDTIITADAYQIPQDHPLLEAVHAAFLQKKPWEVGFFRYPQMASYRLKAHQVVCPARAKE
ncbi:MAG: hypothetical protein ACRC7D_09755 [Aeromonas popoffii]|uniref:hypothetical protein n=1 Tax=Aeromonas TaxID=642 RepID=UPI0020117E3D|nr:MULTISPECIES: hypothetical protein [Aeromonas]